MDDEKIIDLYFAREESAIAATAQKYGAYCRAVAQGVLKNREDALECVNDTYLRAWEAIPPKRPTMLRIFLGKITRNLSLDKHRWLTAAKRGGDTVTTLYGELNECIPGGTTVEEEAEAGQITAAIDASLRKMGQEMRLVFMRRYWHADSLENIAERYSMSLGKVKSMLFRARKKLKSDLEGEGVYI
ncbi:MAG: sigma-70 family RNA polymerase sigma factor [Defluviitaleaceae bacterium]|nr:sigma-70 family RNA polymerase sigma factor [Defluviitaleaceae bacterium]MCL2273980.1 sigma-70 family RNA polymerase sigma factor [Defluviitaleaceae bacterium]